MPTNDNEAGAPPPALPLPDPHGHAALLLVESLIHGLIERGVLDADDAVEIIGTAENVQGEIAEQADGRCVPTSATIRARRRGRLPRSVRLPGARSTTALGHQPHALDRHAAVERLGHVIDRQQRDRDRGQRFHLDAGLAGGRAADDL